MSFMTQALRWFEESTVDSAHSASQADNPPPADEGVAATEAAPSLGPPLIDVAKILAMFGLDPGEGGAAQDEGAKASGDFTKNTAIPGVAPAAVKLPPPSHEAEAPEVNELHASEVDDKTVNERATTIGDGSLTRDNKNTTRDGGKKTIDDRSATIKGSVDNPSLGAELKQTNTTQYSDRVSSTKSTSGGVDLDPKGISAHAGSETKKKVGENEVSSSKTGTVGYSDGHVVANVKLGHGSETEHGGSDAATTIGIANGKASAGREWATTHKNDDGSVDKRSTEGKLAIGPDGNVDVDASRTWSNTNKDGSGTTKNVGFSADSEGNASVSGGMGVKTKSGASASFSAKAGVSVVASEPEKVGDRYKVTYTRTKSIGGSAGASAKGMGVSAGESGSSFETGTRWFEKEEEAKEFKEHAAERIAEMKDESTIAGALSLEVGESRGHGTGADVNGGVSASYSGASLGVAGHESDRSETDVKRVSANLFEVTVKGSVTSGHDVTAGAAGVVNLGRGSSDTNMNGVTYQFDLSTVDGRAAFEKFQQDHLPPTKGAVKTSTEAADAHESHDNMSIAGLGTASYGSNTAEDTIEDKDGTHQVNSGAATHDVDPTWFAHRFLGDDEQHQSVGIEAHRENGVATSYEVVGRFGGENGEANRNHMAALTPYSDDYEDGSVKSSGTWTMSADIPPEQIADLQKYDKAYAGLSDEEKMRKLTEEVADKGSRAVGDIADMGKSLKWDVELKGDPNFPGRAGREKIEKSLESFQSLVEAGGAGRPALVMADEIEKQIEELGNRRAAVGDAKKYTDLPTALRSEELAKIDQDVARFEELHHRAMVLASQADPDEVVKAAEHKTGGNKESPEEKELAQLRVEITKLDAQIAKARQGSQDKKDALRQMASGPIGRVARNAAQLSRQMEQCEQAGDAQMTVQAGLYALLDVQRDMFVRTTAAKDAIPIGKALASQLQGELSMIQSSDKSYEDAQAAFATMTMPDDDDE